MAGTAGSGRRAIPTAINQMRGNPGKRGHGARQAKREPEPELKRPDMPAHLDEAAKAEWERLCPLLEKMRILTEADGIALGNLCFDFSLLGQAAQSLKTTGMLSKNKAGDIRPSPFLRILGELTDRVNRELLQFGLSPSSRTRVNAQEPKPVESKWSQFG